MRVLIVGAGAIGALYGIMLQRAGAKISVFCRTGCDEIREFGVHVKSIWGDGVLRAEDVYSAPQLPITPFDLVLVATKVLPGKAPTEEIAPFVGPETTILLIQNGLHIERPFLERFPGKEILSALAFVCSNRHDICHVEHLDYGRLTIGSARAGTTSRLQAVAKMLLSVGVPVEVSQDIQRDRWIKLLWNVPFNPLSVLGQGASTSDILKQEESRNLAWNLMSEILVIARAAGFDLDETIARKMMDRTEKMTPYRTSMLLDYEARRPMEIETIVGEPLREARRLGISSPHLESIYALLLLLEGSSKS